MERRAKSEVLTLYTYWRSTTSYRVRIALAMKGIEYQSRPVDLLAGEQGAAEYVALNPVAGVPTLVLEDGTALTQSMAILDYLDSLVRDPALLPKRNAILRARVLAAAMVFASDVHPVNNLKVVNRVMDLSDKATGIAWMQHWMQLGCAAFDALIDPDAPFAFGDQPTLADICLVAQLYNAHRWDVDLSATPRLLDIEKRCLALPAFAAARPENQMDAI
ncbi:MAG: maleylacetoacetate isomerase [Pseudomonadota bacterium]